MSPRRRVSAVVVVFSITCALTWHSRSFVGPVEAQGATAIQVDVAANRHPIDPRVYGVNWADAAQLAALNVPVHRWGGNSTTRHNWKTNGDNRGSDWYFESIPGSGAQGAAFDDFVQDSKQNGSEPMVTIPLIGWVGKNGPGGTKLASFSAAKYGAQQDCDWSWYPDACNGVRTNGTYVTGNDPNDANVASNAQYQKEWAQHLVTRWGLAASGGVRYYIYDNEPSLWHHTHRDVHPAGQTMTELRDLMVAYGTAIRQADPGAIFVGPEEWGWSGYFLSGYDQKYGNETGCWSCAPDKAANGGVDFMPWLLGQLRQHEQSTGSRLLHVFSLHYYPQGGEFGSDTSASMQARRNRSTRSLWDPSYTDETWIGDEVRLIPRMKEWVNASYPGLQTGITEYSWGADDHINGATAHADVLGIFGREGLDVGTRWVVPATGTPTFKAIQMYRNYDGSRSTFGDVSVKATVPNPDNLAAFAAERSSDGAVTVMAVNKATSSSLVNLSLANFTAGATAQVWQLTSANAIQHLADVSVAGGVIGTTLPAQSITLFVVPRSTGSTPSLSIGDVSLNEGQLGSTNASFAVSLSAASAQTVSVSYATANGTATAGSDYTAASGVLTFTAGQTSKTVSVPVLGDTAIESNETFVVNLTGPTNATLADAQAVGTILNDDFPTLSIGDITVAEGNSGTAAATFTVTLSAASPGSVTVSYATANGTATAGSDYVAQAGNLTFAAGQTSRTITVLVNGDTTVEPNETFVVDLSGSVGATITDGQGQGTIANDDVAPPSGEPVSWTDLFGVSASGDMVTKAIGASWGDAGAASTRGIVSGDGYAEFTLSASSGYAMFGLSNGNSDQTFSDIDYGFYTYPAGGTVWIYEKGVSRGPFGAYAAGDKLRVSVVSGSVKYFRNSTLLYTSDIVPTYPLRVDSWLYSPGSTVQALLAGTLADMASLPTEPVVWTSLVGVTATGNTISKALNASWGDAGAASTRAITSGDGYGEFTLSASSGYAMFGLSNGDSDQTYGDIDYGFYTYPSGGTVWIYEKGASRGPFGAYAAGDKLRVSVVGGSVKYFRNSTLLYTSGIAPTYPLRVDSWLYSPGATVQALLCGTLADIVSAPIEPVAWTSLVGVTAVGNTVSKASNASWGDAGAASTRGIASGEGYAEFTVSASSGYAMFGLSNGNSDPTYSDIDYGFYTYPAGGTVWIYEKGVSRGPFGSYAAGDKLRVTVSGGKIKYFRNSALLYTSASAPAYPLRVDSWLYSPGSTVQAVLAGSLVTTP